MSYSSQSSSVNDSGTLPDVVDPAKPLDGWSVNDALEEMKAAVTDSSWFLTTMDRNERTRQCLWEGKTGSGRKTDKPGKPAQPWNNAADHEVHLTEEILRDRAAMWLAALARGAVSVVPTNVDDAARSGRMRQVLRYYLTTAMGSNFVTMGLRAGNWADRVGHSLVYVTWKEERAAERREVSRDMLLEALAAQLSAEQQAAAAEQGAMLSEEEQLAMEADAALVMDSPEMEMEARLMDERQHESLAELLLNLDPGLMARGAAGQKEAMRAVKALAKNPEEPVTYISSFVRTSRPHWETLMPFVDVFYPAETTLEDGLDSARWIGRVKWLSAQQIREEAAIRGWNKKWVNYVLANCKGKANAFNANGAGLPDWAMSGMGVRWVNNGGPTQGSLSNSLESHKHLYQLVWLWDRATTPDGLTAVYETVLHPDVPDMVAKRDLLDHWDGMYPFFAVTNEMTEKLLLASRGVAELTKTPQDAIKAQWDSRTDMASLTTVPPWTGPPELKGTRLAPGMFVEQYRVGAVTAFQLPPPDGRSIEIENRLRASVDQLFGRVSDAVAPQKSLLRGQADMDWFLLAITRGVQLTAKLIQQFMAPLTGARIMGTGEVVTATREEVRGSFDYAVAFDMRSLDLDWAKGMLEFINKQLVPLDRRGQINTQPLLEFGFNILHPSLAAVAVQPLDMAQRQEQEDERAAITEIFSGGSPPLSEGQDAVTRAAVMVEEFQKSPLRQQVLATNEQIRNVFLARLEHHVFQAKQYGENAQTGRLGAEDPLRIESPAEQLLGMLKTGGA